MLACSLSKSKAIRLKAGPLQISRSQNGLHRPKKSLFGEVASSANKFNSMSFKSTISTHLRAFTTKEDNEAAIQLLRQTLKKVEAVEADLKEHGVPEIDFEIDRSGMHPFGLKRLETPSIEALEEKKGKRSELVKQLMALIETRGPMSMATFMNFALTHPSYGYYMKSDVFGKEGDFTTSPEISQMFGELLGVWCAAMWEHLGRPPKIHIVEIGPGRGTLSSDMLNATKNMKAFFKAIHLHLVEVSPHLRRLQAQKFGLVYPATINREVLDSIKVPQGLDDHVYQPISGSEAVQFEVSRPDLSKLSEANDTSQLLPDVTLKSLPGTSISWHARFDDIPDYNGEPMLVIAQEFFDALPIYQLEMTSAGWRERLVDIDDRLETPDWFRTTLAPSTTPACTLIEEADEAHLGAKSIGMGVEKCAEGLAVCQNISDRLLKNSGAAIFIDYGYEFTHGWSIRGIKNHEFVSIYREPGEVDLSTNVDFAALTRAALKSRADESTNKLLPNLRVYGSIGQGEFLASLGIYSRMAKLLRKADTEEEAEALIAAFHRLTDKRQMGTNYKVMGIFSSPKLVPEGFEGIDPKSSDDYTASGVLKSSGNATL